MRSLKLTIAYDGTDFYGWQWQPDRRTVQGELEAAIGKVTGETLRVVASGRTDAGVHAEGQVVSFASQSSLESDVLRRALNATLPSDIAVRTVAEVPAGFHAIDDARSKRYRYLLYDGSVRDVFARRYAWHVRYLLDAARMHEAAQALRGTHDFKSYETSGSSRVSTVRTVRDIAVARRSDGYQKRIAIEVQANGFLYNMVRNIVGTLVEVGRGKQDVDWPREVLAARDRRVAGMTAPPQGLYLVQVFFDE
jgi:tRNA pseudouridine38-40 synthase